MTTKIERRQIEIPNKVFFRIGDVAEILGVKPYVLRYWETEFPGVAPKKSVSGQRVYQRGEVEALVRIRTLLYEERYSIEGARKKLKEQGKMKLETASVSKAVAAQANPGEAVRSQPTPEGQGFARGAALEAARELARQAVVPMRDLFKF